jgi:hypothetical protein
MWWNVIAIRAAIVIKKRKLYISNNYLTLQINLICKIFMK